MLSTTRTIVRARRALRRHRATGRTIGTAALAGALLLGGMGTSIASAADDPVTVVDDALAGDQIPEDVLAADVAANGETGDDEESAPLDQELALPSADEIAAALAAQEQLLEDRVVEADHRTRMRELRSRIIDIAKDQIGDPYVPGSSGPNGFDCSGLTRYVYKQATGKELPHYSKAQYQRVKRIALKDAQPGDLVFFLRNGAHHVGIYLGNGKMIDAPGRGRHVRVSPISGSWWSRSFTGLGRILDPA